MSGVVTAGSLGVSQVEGQGPIIEIFYIDSSSKLWLKANSSKYWLKPVEILDLSSQKPIPTSLTVVPGSVSNGQYIRPQVFFQGSDATFYNVWYYQDESKWLLNTIPFNSAPS